ncbi:MAG: SDR family NAD(P)-dependent oxidoreductase [Hyphomicrobiales bacterium]
MAAAQKLQSLFGLDGKVAVVTGASSGIGRRMAVALAQAGARVVCLARREAELRKLQQEGEADGLRIAALPCDLGSIRDFGPLAAEAADPFGAPQILVNAAGVNLREPPDDVTVESWNATLWLNLSAPFFLARALVPGMRRAGGGSIINIASLQSFRAFPNSMPYGASKGGVAQLTRAMAEAWSRDHIRANAILPGFFPTGLTRKVFDDEALARHHANATAIGRNGEIEDIDGVTVFLASRASAYITGQIVALDGGYLAK